MVDDGFEGMVVVEDGGRLDPPGSVVVVVVEGEVEDVGASVVEVRIVVVDGGIRVVVGQCCQWPWGWQASCFSCPGGGSMGGSAAAEAPRNRRARMVTPRTDLRIIA